MMEFNGAEGRVAVNMDMVCTVVQREDGRYSLRDAQGKELAWADRREYDALLEARTGDDALRRAVEKLAAAVERLSVRVPSSVRVHF